MADVHIAADQWGKLRRSANCFLPKILIASVEDGTAFRHTEFHVAARRAGLKAFSLHLIGRTLSLHAITHDKADDFLIAYDEFSKVERQALPTLTSGDIVAALFGLPALAQLAADAGITESELAERSGVSERAIAHAMNNGRVTGGIAYAIHKVLSAKLENAPSLIRFAVSDPDDRFGGTTVEGQPFCVADLVLPLPPDLENPWLKPPRATLSARRTAP